jgi:predicted Zn-dependent peptidase
MSRGKINFAPLDNGAVVVSQSNSGLNASTIGFLVGAREDPEWFEGAAHTTEHIMIRGASDRVLAAREKAGKELPVSGRELTRYMRRYLGGTSGWGMNVYTMHTHTAYGHQDLLYRRYQHLLFGSFARTVRDGMYELRSMQHDAGILDLESLRVEKAAVDNETGENNDDPYMIVMKAGLRQLYRTNPARFWGDSDPSQLATVRMGRLKQWAMGHYVPANMRIILIGPNQNEALRMVGEAGLDQIPAWDPAPRKEIDQSDVVPTLHDVRREVIFRPGIGMTHVLLQWPTEPSTSRDYYALRVLADLLKDRVEDFARENNQRLPGGVYHPLVEWEGASTYGFLRLWFATRGGRVHADELTGQILELIAQIRDGLLETFEEDAEDCRGYLIDAYREAANQSPGEYVDLMLEYLSNGDNKLERLLRYPKRIAGVTPNRVLGVARKYLHTDRFVHVILQPA